MAWYNRAVADAFRLPDFGRSSALGILVGNTRFLDALRANRPWFVNFLPSVLVEAKIPKSPPVLQSLGDHVRARRQDLGLTQRQAGKILGVSPLTVWYWENHRTEPEIGMYPRIVTFLGYCPYRSARSFGEPLFLHRAYRGLSKEKMARRLWVRPDTLSQWEEGTRCPTVGSMEQVARILRSPKPISYHSATGQDTSGFPRWLFAMSI